MGRQIEVDTTLLSSHSLLLFQEALLLNYVVTIKGFESKII